MKQLCCFILILIIANLVLCLGEQSSASLEAEKAKLSKYKVRQPSRDLGEDMPEAISYWEGWANYFHSDGDVTRPHKFFQNNEYFTQRVPKNEMAKSDKFGSFIIPDKNFYYLVVTSSALQVYSSRENSIRKQMDYLAYDSIEPLPEDAYMSGGIKDIGKVGGAGYCIKIKTQGKKVRTWFICVKQEIEKKKLLKALLKLKLKQQRTIGIFRSNTKKDSKVNSKTTNKKDDRQEKNRKSSKDGYWLLLQDWTECTLKCGGGESYQQWQCIPPKDGGKPCQGEAVRVRKCNTQPCPTVQTFASQAISAQPEIKNAIIKVAPFSTLPQRYTPCVVKEADALIAKYDSNLNFEQKLPVRIVMNNSTIAIYKDDTYQNVEYTYPLDKTKLTTIKEDMCCFNLDDSVKTTKLCGYNKYCGEFEKSKWVDQWNSDFNLFKNVCRVGREEVLIDESDEDELKGVLKSNAEQVRIDIVAKKQTKARQQLLKAQNVEVEKQIEKTQDLGLTAIQKELQLEKLIEEEEKRREESELTELKEKIQTERKKADCLTNNIKEKELDTEFIAEKRIEEKELSEVKADVAKTIEKKRIKMKKIIAEMRKKAKLRKQALQSELSSVRFKMAKEVLKSNRKGDVNKCKIGKTNLDQRVSYCDAYFVDDFIRNSECKSESFCYMCCENEFGNNFIDLREKCYDMCDNRDEAASKKA